MVEDVASPISEESQEAFSVDDEILTAPSGAGSSVEYSFEVGAGQGDRLDKFLMSVLPEGIVSREKLKTAIREGLCQIDGAPCAEPKTKVLCGQMVRVRFAEESASIEPHALPLQYIYTDATLAVVNKPHGLTVHPCPSCDEITLAHGMAHDFPQLTTMSGLRPGIVHRLDKDTSGLMVVALREDIRLRLSAAFAERSVQKTYLAIVCGIPTKTGMCREPIGRHPTQRIKMAVKRSGREAHTEWERLYADPQGQFSLLAVTIHTGRTHQIRVHMTHVGHPLVGDPLYTLPKWKSVQERAERQMLHAWKLSFAHPESGERLEFTQPMPDDMRQVLHRLARTTLKVVITGCPGCGKSTVLKHFAEHGMATFSADAAILRLYEAGQPGQKAVARYLGGAFIDPKTGDVNRRALFEAMQADDAVRERVNWMTHPLVYEQLCQFWQTTEAAGESFAVAEIPLWAETRQTFVSEDAPYCIGVACRTETRHRRLAENRGWSPAMCEKMDSWQHPEEQKFAKAQLIIDNNGSETDLCSSLNTAQQRLEAVYAERNKMLLVVLHDLL